MTHSHMADATFISLLSCGAFSQRGVGRTCFWMFAFRNPKFGGAPDFVNRVKAGGSGSSGRILKHGLRHCGFVGVHQKLASFGIFDCQLWNIRWLALEL